MKQLDIDGKVFYSTIKKGLIHGDKNLEITVNPNPSSGHVNIFIRGTNNIASIELINASGQKLKQVNGVNAFDGNYNLMLTGVPKGSYNLLIILPEGTFNKKIIILE